MVFVALLAASSAVGRSSWGAQVGQAPYQVGGLLVDEDWGPPIRGGEVGLTYYAENLKRRTVKADDQGSFIIQHLPLAAVFMIAKAPGYGQAVAFVVADPQLVEEVHFVLPRSGEINGFVVESDGTPVHRARVAVEYQDRLRRRLGEFSDAIARAEALGLRIVTGEPRKHTGGRPGTGVGRDSRPGGFRISGIDPRRPFKVVSEHEVLGVLESDVVTLAPGQVVTNLTLIYQ